MEMKKKKLTDSVLLPMPTTKRKRSKLSSREVRDNRRDVKGKEKETDKLRDWSELPTELLELIVCHLGRRENIRFSAICKRWHSVALSLRVVNQCPWLLFSHKTGICEFYDPSNHVSYSREILELSGARICCSKDGWLLLRKGYRDMFFFNPFTMARIELPMHRSWSDIATFSSAPTSPSCMVFMMRDFRSMVLVSTCHPGDKVWTSVYYEKDSPFDFSSTNPVFCGGLVYGLSGIHKVAVCNPEKRIWSVLDVSPPPLPCSMMGKVMAELNGDLLVICMCYNEEPITLKLDKLEMKWKKVDRFDGLTLFASFFSSHFTAEVPKIMKNSIYFPKVRMYGKRCISYSLDHRRYYPNRCWNDWGDQGAFGNQMESFTWIEPPQDVSNIF